MDKNKDIFEAYLLKFFKNKPINFITNSRSIFAPCSYSSSQPQDFLLVLKPTRNFASSTFCSACYFDLFLFLLFALLLSELLLL